MLQNGITYITVNHIRHWCKIAGTKHKTIPIVVVHGGPGGNHYVFERTIGQRLEEFTTVIYYEQRGCGRSDAPENKNDYSIPTLVDDLEKLREELQIPKFHLLGYSFGGQLSLEYTLAYPERVATLLLQAPSSGDSEHSYHVQLTGFEKVAQKDIKQQIQHILQLPVSLKERYDMVWNIVDTATVDRLLFQDEKYAKYNRSLWEESGLINPGLMAKALFQSPPSIPLKERTYEITIPSLFLVGMHDRNTGIEMTKELASNMPNATFALFEHSAHFPDMEETEAYAMTIKKFLL
ncbi:MULTISPECIES: alpha/beta fold hydrolase [Bacillus cereus group]|uniref:Proline iminopeptidase n=1 Tax=Bacillus cereus TaxID=1396 RepID=A0AA44QAD0_BACCE|nr:MULTISPECIES: alpha/beta fold hydrolase [Bacillus cereus group]PFA22694.1 proline iminopeptidase [Bacillus cereus]PFN03521.1 proline iminopeptidase [Bacillus cereus]PFO79843.1 proline iminopeptidase [Bacillus cereus]PFR24031.1 proline iminopeptidase [Bacillus cereus]PFR99811.1 proline iminopeptidase [Bacillus cereus]